MTKIKLCGLSRESDIITVNKLKPDYIGFIFCKSSRRFVDKETASRLKSSLDKDILAVGVFVNEEIDTILSFNDTIDVIQLHGNETNDYILKLKALTNKKIIKAFRIDSENDILEAKNSQADFLLLDSENGGTGTTFDWKLIKDISRPYFLAGGLNSNNVIEAIKEFSPFGVDVSSGIETAGLKDYSKMQSFVELVRTYDERRKTYD